MTENPIEKYVRENSYRLAKKLDENIFLVIKPKPWYCPNWLYKRIIKDSVEIVNIHGNQ